jgi:hypothetical protein
VAKVFHWVPQLENGGSGVPRQSHIQRLDSSGRQKHCGHLTPLNGSSASRRNLSTTTISVGDQSCFNIAGISGFDFIS